MFTESSERDIPNRSCLNDADNEVNKPGWGGKKECRDLPSGD